jgi:hypothetical protein
MFFALVGVAFCGSESAQTQCALPYALANSPPYGSSFLTVYSGAKSSGFLGASGYSNFLSGLDARGDRGIGTIMSWTKS